MSSIKFYALLLVLCFYSMLTFAENSYAEKSPTEWLLEDIGIENIFASDDSMTIKLAKLTLSDAGVNFSGAIYYGGEEKTADVQLHYNLQEQKISTDFSNINMAYLNALLPFDTPQDDYRLTLEFNLQEQKIINGKFSLQSKTINATGDFTADTDFNLYNLQLQADEVTITDDIFPETQTLKNINGQIHYNSARQHLQIEQFGFQFRETILEGSAEINQERKFQATLRMDEQQGVYYSAENLNRDWPLNIASSARNWVVENIHAGKAYGGEMFLKGQIENSLPRLDEFSFDLKVKNGNFTYWDILPTVQVENALLQFSKDELIIQTNSGSTEDMQNISAKMIIPFGENIVATTAIDIYQNFDSILKLVNAPKVELLKDLVPEQAIGNNFIGRLKLQFPMIQSLQRQQIEFSVEGALYGLHSPTTPFGSEISLSADVLQIDANNKRLIASSDNVVINSLTTKVQWQVPLQSDAPPLYRVWFDFDSLQQLGLLQDVRLGGSSYPVGEYASGDILIELMTIGKEQFSIRADLTEADVDIYPLNIHKASGLRGILKTELAILQNDIWQLHDLTYQDNVNFLALSAEIMAREDAPLRKLHLARLRTPTSDFRADIDTRTDNSNAISYHINIDAKRLDLIHLLNFTLDRSSPESEILEAELDEIKSSEREEKSSLPNMVIIMSTDELTGDSQDSNIRNVNFAAEYYSQKWIDVDFAGQIDGALSYANYAANNTNSRLNADIPDLGKFLKYSGLSERIQGGELKISAASLKVGEPMIGSFEVNNFHILRSPLLARLLQITSPALASALSGEGIYFQNWHGKISYKDNIIAIANGHVQGPSIAMTMEGTVNRKQNQIKMQGTLVPFYWLLGLPIIGDILGSDSNNAVIGFSYNIEGKTNDADVNVNPLSIVTRLLKSIFGAKDIR